MQDASHDRADKPSHKTWPRTFFCKRGDGVLDLVENLLSLGVLFSQFFVDRTGCIFAMVT
jgi:hypothetical protein